MSFAAVRARTLVLAGLLAAGAGCDRTGGTGADIKAAAPAAAFVDATAAAGIDFRHENGMTGDFLYPEIIGSGVAVLDYDNDGRLDVLALQGGPLDRAARKRDAPCTTRLLRNEAGTGGTPRFVDVTAAARLCGRGYSMGVATGDFDNDGFVDLFLTHFDAPNQLFRNAGNGTFVDVTARAGVAGTGEWGTSASFLDFDRDGLLDLYVTNYVDYSVARNQKCFASTSVRDYCAPSAYKPVAGRLYRNRGNGTFEDVSVKSGIRKVFGAGLGVMAADLDEDGWLDLYVANDGNPNQLWINRKNGTFRDEAPLRGSAVNGDGAPEAGMGVDIADFDGNGTEDIFLTHLTREKSTLFFNLGGGNFEDRSVQTGVAAPSIPFTGFGTVFFDYDNDGWLDVVQANGAVRLIEELRLKGDPYPLHQRKLLLRNLGNGRFADDTAAGGAAFELSEVGRGLAAGDLDNDGRVDLVVSNNNGPLRVFLNRAGGTNAWIGLRLLRGKRDAYGAKIELARAGAPAIWRRVRTDGSYLSANDPRVVIGLGAGATAEKLTVHWPDGAAETFPVPPPGRYTTLVQGTGTKR